MFRIFQKLSLDKLSLILIGLILQSCVIYGLTNDFSKLNPEQKQLISKYDSTVKLEAKQIYEISAMQLKEEFKNHEKSIVYLFANGCTSEYCLPLSVYERYAEENGYHLFLVMNGYGNLSETLSQNISLPLYAVDAEAYGTKWNDKYMRRFENELKNLPLNARKQKYQGDIYFFERDSLVKVQREL